MTATSAALPPVRTSTHVPLSLMTSISEETIALWLKLGAMEKLEQAVLDGYGDQLSSKTSRIPQVNKFLKHVPLFQSKIQDIHQAVSQGRLRDVQHLIDRKKLAFCRDHNGASPLHKAVLFGHQDVIAYLVRRYGGAIHIRDHQGRTALHYAAFLPDQGEIYQYLLASGADERAMDVYGRQPSFYLDGQNEVTLRQLREGTTLNGIRKIKPRYYGQIQPFSNSNRPVISKSQIRALISEGSLEALEDVVLQGQGDRLLGETSPVPRIQSFLNIVPMYMERIYDVHRAVMRDQLEHVVFLLENRRLAMARDQLGATPLHKAVWFGHYKIAHYISHEFPETLNGIDMEGCTALHYATVLKDNKNMYGILIEAGANKAIFDNKGKPPDYYAQYPEHLNLDDVIKRCHKVNANYLANTANRIKGKSPVRQTPPPSNGNSSSPRSEDNSGSSKESGSNGSGNENEFFSMLQKDNFSKRLDMSSANIRRWVNAKDMDKLEKAIMEGYGEKVVRAGEDQLTDKITEMVKRINAIHTAVSSDDLSELQNYLEEKYFALAKDHMGMTPLHRAVLLRRTNIVTFLTEKFPETINAKNKDGRTALHYAAATSRKDGQNLYKMLLQAGADPKVRDSHGRMPDYYKTHLMTLPNKGMMKTRPAGWRHSETLNRYSKQGVMERMTTAMQRGDVDLLHDLVLEGHGRHLLGKTSWNDDVKSFLKDLLPYLNTIQSFHEAVKEGDFEKVKKLLSSNDKLMRARDENSASPMHIAARTGNQEMMQYFIENYPSVLNLKDSFGRTPLHIAGLKGAHVVFKMLKDAGADTKHLDQKGKTANFYLQNYKPENSQIAMTNGCSDVSTNSSSESLNTNLNRREARSKLLRRNNRKGINGIKNAKILKNNIPEEINENSENFPSSVALRTKRKSEAKRIAGDENGANAAETNKEEEDEDNAEGAEVNGDIAAEADVEDGEGEEKSDDSPEDPVDSEENGAKTDDEAAPEENDCDEGEDKGNVEENLPADNEDDNTNEIAVDDNEANEHDENQNDEEKNDENEDEDEAKENDIEECKNEVEEGVVNEEETVAEDGEINEDEETKAVDESADAEEENSNEDNNEGTQGEEQNQDEAGITVAEVGSGQAASTDDVENSDEPTIDEKEENNPNVNTVGEEECDESKDDVTENNDGGDETDEVELEKKVEDNEEGEPEEDSANNVKENEGSTEKSVEIDAEKEDVENAGEEKADENKEEEADDVEEEEKVEEENPRESEEQEAEKPEESEEQKAEEAEENKEEEADAEENEVGKSEEDSGEKLEESNCNERNEEDQEAEKNTEEDNDAEKTAEEDNEAEKTTDDDINEQNDEEEQPRNYNEEKPEGKLEDSEEDNNERIVEATNAEETVLEPETESKPEDTEEAATHNEEVSNNTEGENNEENNEALSRQSPENEEESKENVVLANEQSHQTKDHLDELIEHWIKEGDLLRLEHVVLAGQGDRLIERTSHDKQVQDFLDLVPIYMGKIRAVHESVAKGQLREVRSVLTRKRFALSRDHVGASPLHLAVLHGHTDVSTYIISHFPETMDGPDNEGRTPLHYATALQDTGTLYRLLKSAGADENIEDKAGYSPKYYLNHPGKLTLVQLLEPYSSTE